MFEATSERAAWFNWRAFGRAVSVVWKRAYGMGEQNLTDYLFESEIGKSLTEAQPDFTAAGVSLSPRPTPSELLERLKRLAQRPNAPS